MNLNDIPGPWDWSGNPNEVDVHDQQGRIIASVSDETGCHRTEIASRICQCVNACAGMDNPEQRIGYLIGALKSAAEFILRHDMPDEDEQEMADEIDRVIEQAKGETK